MVLFLKGGGLIEFPSKEGDRVAGHWEMVLTVDK